MCTWAGATDERARPVSKRDLLLASNKLGSKPPLFRCTVTRSSSKDGLRHTRHHINLADAPLKKSAVKSQNNKRKGNTRTPEATQLPTTGTAVHPDLWSTRCQGRGPQGRWGRRLRACARVTVAEKRDDCPGTGVGSLGTRCLPGARGVTSDYRQRAPDVPSHLRPRTGVPGSASHRYAFLCI